MRKNLWAVVLSMVLCGAVHGQIPDVPRRSYAQPSSGPSYRAPASGRLGNSVPRRTNVRSMRGTRSFQYRVTPDASNPLGVDSRRTYHRLIGPVNALEYSNLPGNLGRVTFDRLNRNVVLPPQLSVAQDQLIVPHTLLNVEPLVVPTHRSIGQPAVAVAELTGWQMLNNGQDRAALRSFAETSLRESGNGESRLGYALLIAFKGDASRAVFSLRRACDVDATAVTRLPVEPKLRARLEKLLSDLEPKTSARNKPFLRAVLLQLTGQSQAAQDAIAQARQAGDNKSSTQKLRAALESAAPEKNAAP